ncbi:MAG: saccharopine dehydrogenase family protein [Parvularculaceae bacterium]
MKDVLLVGAGNIGEMSAWLLGSSGDYRVTLGDRAADPLKAVEGFPNVEGAVFDATDEGQLREALDGKFAVLSAAPFFVTAKIAKIAHDAGVHYLDLTEDVASTDLVKELSASAQAALIPQCGLAPGFVSIAGMHLARQFDELDTLHMRVGALPRYPNNALGYNLNWSVDGVINEYIEPCDVVSDGVLRKAPALEELEKISIDGVEYEAFNTSGGLGTLAETLQGKVRDLNYRTMRYPGHRDIMKLLIQDLKLGEKRELFRDILVDALPAARQDVVVIYVSASGRKDGKLVQETYAKKVFAEERDGKHWTAIQITTASAICAVLDMLKDGDIPDKGFIKQEDIPLPSFLENRFGRAYV